MKFIEIKKNRKGKFKELEIRSIERISFDLFTKYIYFYTFDKEKTYKLKLFYFSNGSTFFRKMYNFERFFNIKLFYEPFGFNYGFNIIFRIEKISVHIEEYGSLQLSVDYGSSNLFF